jgi:2,3-dimethylmalate lyase
MSARKRFRKLLEQPEILVLAGVHDALSARIAASQGFEALNAGGNAATGILLGEPDMGQMNMRDYADHYGRIADATDLPIFVDADTGFGGVHNVRKMIQAFEHAGVAGLFIEDQVFPKRCGYFDGKAVVPPDEMITKIKAAVDARRDADMVIQARTDALGVLGVNEAIERAQMYAEAGADVTFVQGADSLEDLTRICREVRCPQFANVSQAGRLKSTLSIKQMQDAGACAVTFPIAAMLAAAAAMKRVLAGLRRDGSLAAVQSELMDFGEYTTLVGIGPFQEREKKYAEAATAVAARHLGKTH